MYTDQGTIWVNGTSNYWNSTSYPGNYSQLFPADECDVTVTLDGTGYDTMTDEFGNYSIEIPTPTTPGQYSVNVSVKNTTASNRNVPCVFANQTIEVNPHILDLTVATNATATFPANQLWANGTVELDSALVGAGMQVNLTVKGTAISWNVTTGANGNYSSQFTVPATVGTYTLNATVWDPAHNLKAWNQTTFYVTEKMLPDLNVTAAEIVRTGQLLEGVNQMFNVTVRNGGTAAATAARINITMDGTLLNSTVRTIAAGQQTVIYLNWTATPGSHNITVLADPQNTTEEFFETNNNATKQFTIAARTIGITLGLNAANVEPGTPMWANGTVTMDGAAAVAGVQVNVSVSETGEYWLVNTNATGKYSAPFDASSVEDDYTVNASVKYPGYSKSAYDTADFTVAIPPTPDLSVANANISVNGELVNGSAMFFRVEVRNIGTDAAKDVAVNITMDGALLYASTQNIAAKAQRVLNVSWTAVAGDHNLSVEVDPAGKIAEFSETNNHAWKTFTIAPSAVVEPDLDADDDGVLDADDAFPDDPDEWEDTDGDGTGDNADTDDDDDGVPDEDDLDPTDPDVGEAKSDNTMLIIAVVAIIAIVAVAAGLMLMKKGKTPGTGPQEAEPTETEPQPEDQPPEP